MKNRILFTVTAIIIITTAVSLPLFAGSFYDIDGHEVYAEAWTFWDSEQFETSMPYLDVWTSVMNINSTHGIYHVKTYVTRSGYTFPYEEFDFYTGFYGTQKRIVAPVAAFEASQFVASVGTVDFTVD